MRWLRVAIRAIAWAGVSVGAGGCNGCGGCGREGGGAGDAEAGGTLAEVGGADAVADSGETAGAEGRGPSRAREATGPLTVRARAQIGGRAGAVAVGADCRVALVDERGRVLVFAVSDGEEREAGAGAMPGSGGGAGELAGVETLEPVQTWELGGRALDAAWFGELLLVAERGGSNRLVAFAPGQERAVGEYPHGEGLGDVFAAPELAHAWMLVHGAEPWLEAYGASEPEGSGEGRRLERVAVVTLASRGAGIDLVSEPRGVAVLMPLAGRVFVVDDAVERREEATLLTARTIVGAPRPMQFVSGQDGQFLITNGGAGGLSVGRSGTGGGEVRAEPFRLRQRGREEDGWGGEDSAGGAAAGEGSGGGGEEETSWRLLGEGAISMGIAAPDGNGWYGVSGGGGSVWRVGAEGELVAGWRGEGVATDAVVWGDTIAVSLAGERGRVEVLDGRSLARRETVVVEGAPAAVETCGEWLVVVSPAEGVASWLRRSEGAGE